MQKQIISLLQDVLLIFSEDPSCRFVFVCPESNICSTESQETRRWPGYLGPSPRGGRELRALNARVARTFSCYEETSRLICCAARTSEEEKHVSLPISVHASVRAASGGVLSEDCNGAALEGIKSAAGKNTLEETNMY